MNEDLGDFFISMLGRLPLVPIPPENAAARTWKDFASELERRDPDALEVLRTFSEICRRAENPGGGEN